MFPKLKKSMSSCWRPSTSRTASDDAEANDVAEWSRNLDKHFSGEFSFAVVQANKDIEDHSQVETASHALFVGVYDGHGGPQAARFVRENLFLQLINLAQENGTMSEDVIRNAFAVTEEKYLALVGRVIVTKREIAAVGSCCLVGIIWEETLYVASLGDSKAVLGHEVTSNQIVAEQLSTEHNARHAEVREELIALNPGDPDIVIHRNMAWRVKGIIQVSRAIGDAYLKRPEFAFDESFPRFYFPRPLTRPALSAEPTLLSRVLGPNDKFLIFASDGLWDHMTNQQAVDIVFTNPRSGIARRLLRTALNNVAKASNRTYKEIRQTALAQRRAIHDDITVIVIFVDHELLEKNTSVPEQSIRGFIDTAGPSHFSILKGNNAASTSKQK